MTSLFIRPVALLFLLFTTGCDDSSTPKVSETQATAEPEKQATGERFWYSCQEVYVYEPPAVPCRWMPHLPPAGRMIIDLHFGRRSDGEMLTGEPTSWVLPSDTAAVRAAGGRVHYVFSVPIARVEIDRDQIPGLVRSPNGVAQSAFTPVDLGARDLAVRIFFSRPARESDADVVEKLGGRVQWRPDPVNDGRPMMDACVPDQVIPRVQAIPGLSYLRSDGGVVRCSKYRTFRHVETGGMAAPPTPSRGSTSKNSRPAKLFDIRLEMPTNVHPGEAAPLTLVVRNVHEHTMQVRAQQPTFDFVVTAPNGDVVWNRFRGKPSLGRVRTWNLDSGKTLEFKTEWNQHDRNGRSVPPGVYSVRGFLFSEGPPIESTRSLEILP